MRKKMRRTEMYLTQKQHSEVLNESNKREITFSEMMRKIIDYYYEGNK